MRPGGFKLEFTDHQVHRYSRHIILPEVGGKGQRRLLESRVLLAGAGAVGSAAALYLAGAGVGQITIADGSVVSLRDLQSQILHSTQDLNLDKTRSARDKLLRLNPDVQVDTLGGSFITTHPENLHERYNILLDATENGASHYLLNQACVAVLLPLVIADLDGFRARIQTVVPGDGPCYRCLYPQPAERPSQALLGPLAGAVGCLLATEAIKLLINKGRPLSGAVLDIDLLAVRFSLLPATRDANCPVCGGVRRSA